MAPRQRKSSARLRAATAVTLVACALPPPAAAASFLTAPLEALRSRTLLSRAASPVVVNVKAAVSYTNASAAQPTVVSATNQGRYGHSAVYLPPPTNELLLIGGQVGENGTAITGDVLRFRVASSFLWGDRPVSAIPDNPAVDAALASGVPATAWAASALDSDSRTWLVGGITPDCETDAIAHVLPAGLNSSWSVPALSPRYPPRRRQAKAVAVHNSTTGGSDVWVLGGIADQYSCSSETIGYAGIDRYDTVSGVVESMVWNAPGGVDPSDWEPPVSDYAAAVLDNDVGIVVIGGQDSDGHLVDMAEVLNFDIASRIWTQQSVSNVAPAPRMGHASLVLPSGSILIHGGLSSAHAVLSDLFLLSPSTSGWLWTEVVISNHSESAPALAYHTATQIAGDTIVVAFGIDGATSAPSSSFWFLTVDETAGTYTWTDTFDGNAAAVALAESSSAPPTTTFVGKFAKKAVEVVANPKAQTSAPVSSVAQTAAPSLGMYGTAESEAPASVPAQTSSSSLATSSSSAATAVQSASSSVEVTQDQEESATTSKGTIIGASLGAIGAVAAAGGLLFFLLRRRAAQGARTAPPTPVVGSTGNGSAPLVSQLLYTRPAQGRNMSLGSTLSALSPHVESLPSDSPNLAGVGARGGSTAAQDPFRDSYRVTEDGQLERAGSTGSAASSTGGVVGAIVSTVGGLVGSSKAGGPAGGASGDPYTTPAPTLTAKRSLRRSSALPVPGTPAELIGMAITSADGHDGLPYLANTSNPTRPLDAASTTANWDPAVSLGPSRHQSRPSAAAMTTPSAPLAGAVAHETSPVPAILRPEPSLRVANPDPFADP